MHCIKILEELGKALSLIPGMDLDVIPAPPIGIRI